jgi:hypothetical protein
MTKHKTRNWWKQVAHAVLYGSDKRINKLPPATMQIQDVLVLEVSESESEQIIERFKKEENEDEKLHRKGTIERNEDSTKSITLCRPVTVYN